VLATATATACRLRISSFRTCAYHHTSQAMRAAAQNLDSHQLLVELAGQVECCSRVNLGLLR
jgi:hypothetical protein